MSEFVSNHKGPSPGHCQALLQGSDSPSPGHCQALLQGNATAHYNNMSLQLSSCCISTVVCQCRVSTQVYVHQSRVSAFVLTHSADTFISTRIAGYGRCVTYQYKVHSTSFITHMHVHHDTITHHANHSHVPCALMCVMQVQDAICIHMYMCLCILMYNFAHH
jgi:hypothetical protein